VERFWDSFYTDIIRRLSLYKVWFATGLTATRWFSLRRNLQFSSIVRENSKIKIRFKDLQLENFPGMVVRYYMPQSGDYKSNVKQGDKCCFVETTIDADEIQFSVN